VDVTVPGQVTPIGLHPVTQVHRAGDDLIVLAPRSASPRRQTSRSCSMTRTPSPPSGEPTARHASHHAARRHPWAWTTSSTATGAARSRCAGSTCTCCASSLGTAATQTSCASNLSASSAIGDTRAHRQARQDTGSEGTPRLVKPGANIAPRTPGGGPIGAGHPNRYPAQITHRRAGTISPMCPRHGVTPGAAPITATPEGPLAGRGPPHRMSGRCSPTAPAEREDHPAPPGQPGKR